MSINVFIRQPFTQSDGEDQRLIQGAMDVLKGLQETFDLNFLTKPEAENAETFKSAFEKKTGLAFTPKNFRKYRLGLLDKADVFINIRTGLSESGAFEIAYNILRGRNAPMFFAIWEKAAIKTTLLRELDDLGVVSYVTFKEPEELKDKLVDFLQTEVLSELRDRKVG